MSSKKSNPDLMVICRTSAPKTRGVTFCSSMHRGFISKLATEPQEGMRFWSVLFTDGTQAPRTVPGIDVFINHIIKLQSFADKHLGCFAFGYWEGSEHGSSNDLFETPIPVLLSNFLI